MGYFIVVFYSFIFFLVVLFSLANSSFIACQAAYHFATGSLLLHFWLLCKRLGTFETENTVFKTSSYNLTDIVPSENVEKFFKNFFSNIFCVQSILKNDLTFYLISNTFYSSHFSFLLFFVDDKAIKRKKLEIFINKISCIIYWYLYLFLFKLY